MAFTFFLRDQPTLEHAAAQMIPYASDGGTGRGASARMERKKGSGCGMPFTERAVVHAVGASRPRNNEQEE